MPNYIRIINRPRWPVDVTKDVDIKKLSASTITMELRTIDNDLSLWAVEDEDDAVLAMVTNAEKFQAMWTLRISEDIMRKNKLEIKNDVSNKTNVKGIGEFHYNIKNLTYQSLADVAKAIIEALKKEDENLKNYSKEDVQKVLENAIKKGKVDPKKLKSAMKERLKITL